MQPPSPSAPPVEFPTSLTEVESAEDAFSAAARTDETASTRGGAQTRWIGAALLILLGLSAYSNSIRNSEFIFDDQMWLDQLRQAPSIWSSTLWSDGNEGPQHGRPVVAFSLALDFWLHGDRMSGFRMTNLGIHIVASLSLFFTLRLVLQRSVIPTSVRRAAGPLAWFASALWLIHPLQTECVNYISQRTESLAACSLLLALYGALRSQTAARHPWRWMAFAVGALWTGAGCKESIALAPLLVVLLEWTTDPPKFRAALPKRWPFYAALFSVWIPVGLLVYLAPRTRTVGANADCGAIQYLLNQCRIIPDYFRLTLWPDALALDYGEPLPVTLLDAAPGGLLLIALLGLGVFYLFRRPPIGLAICWVFLTLAPTSSVIPIQTEVGAERRMYLPLAAVSTALVVAAYYAFDRYLVSDRLATLQRRVAFYAPLILSGALMLALLVRTRQRNDDYANPLGLWQSSFVARPDNPRAIYNLGVRLSQLGQVDAAIAAYRLTIKVDPNYVIAHNNLGLSLRQRGDYVGAKRHFEEAASRYRNWTLALNNLARLYAACPHPELRDGEEAVRIAEAICRSHPNQPPYLETLAAAYAERGDFDKAVRRLQEARDLLAPVAPGNLSRLDALIAQYRRRQPFRFPPTANETLSLRTVPDNT